MRFKINVDGEWRGDSYATEAEAKVAAGQLRSQSPGQKVEVVSKGTPLAPPAPEPAPPARK